MSARKGKIGRLPYEIREELNERLRDGQAVKTINAWLVKAKVRGAPFNDQNFTNWRQGGYPEWLDEQKRLEAIRKKYETLRRELEAGGASIIDRGMLTAATAIVDAIDEKTDPAKVAKALIGLKIAQTEDIKAQAHKSRAETAKEKLALDRTRLEIETCRLFLKWYKDLRAREIAESDLSNEDKIRQLRENYFADVDALEASGEVVLPE